MEYTSLEGRWQSQEGCQAPGCQVYDAVRETEEARNPLSQERLLNERLVHFLSFPKGDGNVVLDWCTDLDEFPVFLMFLDDPPQDVDLVFSHFLVFLPFDDFNPVMHCSSFAVDFDIDINILFGFEGGDLQDDFSDVSSPYME